MSENNNASKQPQKWTRADELHARRVRLGEIQEEKAFNKMRFAVIALIVLAVMVILILLCGWRADLINQFLIDVAADPSLETPFDKDYESIYRFARFILIVAAAAFAFWLLDGAAGVVGFYRLFVGPAIGSRCVLEPSCSQYFLEAGRKHGIVGVPMVADRFVREPVVSASDRWVRRPDGSWRHPDPVSDHDGWFSKEAH